MNVKVKLFATLRPYLGNVPAGTAVELQIQPGSTLNDLVSLLKLPPDDVKVCFVNARIVELDQILAEGDEIGIFPPIGGG